MNLGGLIVRNSVENYFSLLFFTNFQFTIRINEPIFDNFLSKTIIFVSDKKTIDVSDLLNELIIGNIAHNYEDDIFLKSLIFVDCKECTKIQNLRNISLKNVSFEGLSNVNIIGDNFLKEIIVMNKINFNYLRKILLFAFVFSKYLFFPVSFTT